ncbi:hypothetical protein [Elongatibacter sediminis]|uniref:Uncharacterized protein n=1 Tax=Elongatibacter sediminis TaxID=3119006 RepID=A0AAW9RB33_9GAMM
MLSFGKHKRLAKAIDAFMVRWIEIQAMDGMLSGTKAPPQNHLAMCGILWGVTDSLGQLQGLDVKTTVRGLKLYLAKYADGESMFRLVVAAPHNPEAQPWVHMFGSAVRAIAEGKDPIKVLLPLAEKFRLGIA